MNNNTMQIIGNNSAVLVGHTGGSTGNARCVNARGTVKVVPVGLLSFAAGADAWMRQIRLSCADCGKVVLAGDMECEMCQDCLQLAYEENARMDGVA